MICSVEKMPMYGAQRSSAWDGMGWDRPIPRGALVHRYIFGRILNINLYIYFYVISAFLGQNLFGLSIKTLPISPIGFFRHRRSLPIGQKPWLRHWPEQCIFYKYFSQSCVHFCRILHCYKCEWKKCLGQSIILI